MIVDIPTHSDFEESGVALLNIAWDTVMTLLLDLEDARDCDYEIEDIEYWEAAQKSLATSLALVHQGTELLLKGRIAAISPYLLIVGNPKDWPKGCDKGNTAFADFRTIEAQDLIRVHNTVVRETLPVSFITNYAKLRRLRNTIMHTVDKRVSKDFNDVILTILDVFEVLVTPQGWFSRRRIYLERHPNAVAYTDEYVEGVLVREGLKLIEILKPKECNKYLGYNKKSRSYLCPSCAYSSRESDITPYTAQLRPNSPESTTLYCFICNNKIKVVRKKCVNPDCKSNVIDAEDEYCLLCEK